MSETSSEAPEGPKIAWGEDSETSLTPEQVENAKEAFSHIDVYGSGNVCFEDCYDGLAELGIEKALAEEIMKHIMALDQHEDNDTGGGKDGRVNLKEFLKAVEHFEELQDLERKRAGDFGINELSGIKLRELPTQFTDGVQVAHTEDNMIDAVKRMNELGFRSIPCVDDHQHLQGMLDFADVVVFVLNLLEDYITLEAGYKVFQRATVGSVMQMANMYPVTSIVADDRHTLKDAAALMYKLRMRRVPVVHADQRVANVVSQPLLVAFMLNNLRRIEETQGEADGMDLGVENVETIQEKMVSVPEETATLEEAMRALAENHVYSVAVVDRNGAFVGHVSFKDACVEVVRSTVGLEIVHTQVKELVSYRKRLNDSDYHRRIKVMHGTRLSDITRNFVEADSRSYGNSQDSSNNVGSIQRIFVVDARYVPIKVISMLDLMPFMMYLDKQHAPKNQSPNKAQHTQQDESLPQALRAMSFSTGDEALDFFFESMVNRQRETKQDYERKKEMERAAHRAMCQENERALNFNSKRRLSRPAPAPLSRPSSARF